MDKKTKPITEKYALDYYRHSRPTRTWKWWWNVAAVGLGAAVVAGVYLFERDAAFHAAPVSSVHSTFGNRCELCHDQAGHTAWRLITLGDSFHSVSDAACQACHRAAVHQTDLVAGPACVACHQEHRPDQALSHVMDGHCTDCHRQLELDDGQPASFFAEIDRFGVGGVAHPEFAVLRTSEEDVGPRHGAHAVAAFAAAGRPGTRQDRMHGARGGQWVDRGGLKFNHKMHLDPAGVVHPDREKRLLACSACHVPEASGQYMQPIEYERHCAQCHPLRLTGPLSRLGEIPHRAVEEVRGVVRERLSRLRQESQREASADRSTSPPGPPGAAPPRLALLPTPAVLSEADELKIDELMVRADHAVFGLEAKGMCRHCHHVEIRDGEWHVPHVNPLVGDGVVRGSPDPAHRAGGSVGRPATTNKMVPDRWLPHARFDHQSHRAIQCGECHAAAESSATGDILLPSIAV
jgi:hypothetical protein